jgi:4-hydroxybenzoate polyprenyltransferase
VRWPRPVGWLLVALSLVGFLTVADDLRHVGEVLGVASLLVVGVLLAIAGSTPSRSRRAAALWLAGALGIGAAVGAAVDDMPIGTGGGLIVGLVLAAVVALRRERASA